MRATAAAASPLAGAAAAAARGVRTPPPFAGGKGRESGRRAGGALRLGGSRLDGAFGGVGEGEPAVHFVQRVRHLVRRGDRNTNLSDAVLPNVPHGLLITRCQPLDLTPSLGAPQASKRPFLIEVTKFQPKDLVTQH